MQMKKRKDLKKVKLNFIAGMFSCILLVLFIRVVYLTRVYGEDYNRKVIEQQAKKSQKENIVKAKRGNIYDRNNQVIATSFVVDNIFLDIAEMRKAYFGEEGKVNEESKKSVEFTLNTLSKNLNIPIETLKGYLNSDKDTMKANRHFYVAKGVDKKISTAILNAKEEIVDEKNKVTEENNKKYRKVKFVYTDESQKRFYTNNSFASQVIGFLEGENIYGLEREYDKDLKGKDGILIRNSDVSQGSSKDIKQNVTDGFSIVTTIDSSIQKLAEKIVKTSHEKYPSRNTELIVLNPKTGEVLAMAQYPPYNLNDPKNINDIPDLVLQAELANASEGDKMNKLFSIWKNHAVSSSYEPGSIYKPLVVAEALDEGLISLNTTFECTGKKNINGTDIYCNNRTGHGHLTLTEAIAKSCNVALMDIAAKLGPETFNKYHKDFGYGQKTDIDLPFESTFETLQYSLNQLKNPVQLATSSFGQGFNSSPIQSIAGFASVINGGNLMKPYVVSQVLDNKGNVIYENKPTIKRKVISQETSKVMRLMLQSVVSEIGTGRKAVIPGYAIGGKSGTGEQGIRQKDRKLQEYTTSFMEFFPADDPDYIILGIMDIPKPFIEGVTVPLPMVKELAQEIINYKGILPTKEINESDTKKLDKNSLILDDLTDKSVVEATKYANANGIDYEIVGNGDTISEQSPVAGTVITRDSRLYFYVEDRQREKLTIVPNIEGISLEEALELIKKAELKPFVVYNNIQDDLSSEPDVVDLSNILPAQSEAVESTENPDGVATKSTEASNANETAKPTETLPSDQRKVRSATIIEQMPGKDSKIPIGTEIKLKIKEQ